MEDEGGQDADDQRPGVTEKRGGRGGKLIPEFAQGGGHGSKGGGVISSSRVARPWLGSLARLAWQVWRHRLR